MPNIETWGLRKVEAEKFMANIWDALSDEPFVDESVVTIIESTVTDRNGKSQPFLRVVCDKREDLDRTLELLTPLGFGIESMLLCREFVQPPAPKPTPG